MIATQDLIFEQVKTIGMIAGFRGAFPPDAAVHVTDILMDEGINVFELTMNSERPLEAMQAVKAAYGDDAYVGMGTVLDVNAAQQVMDAGADFVVSPAFDIEVVRYVQHAGVMMIPGVLTPTEAVQAWATGVPLLKVFPIGAAGVPFFKAMFGPLGHMNFMCNGAMHDENAGEFIKAGAIAAGMSGWLTGDGSTPAETIRARAQSLKAAIAAGRSA